MEIDKSPSDDREYRFLKLDNKLRVILIHDEETTKSAASMQVGVGSAKDPKEYPGLAHFLEHMLFMGTEKYPDEAEYSKYCSDFGGYKNAYTSMTDTNYYFEISNEGFDKALDMFAHFFISPLFDKDSVDKEMNVVDSEYKDNFQDDEKRFDQLTLNESNPESALNRFSTGNLETLKKEGVVETLKEFHKEWYSANIMNLVVYSNKSLEEQETMVKELFSAVENKEVVPPCFKEPKCYPVEDLGQLYTVISVMKTNDLKLVWYLDKCYQNELYPSVENILWNVVGHEGENSLLSYLIKKDLAISLSTDCDYWLDVLSVFTIEIKMTSKGLKRYKRIIEITFKMLQILTEQGPVDHAYEECSKYDELKWKFLEKSDAVDAALELSERMKLFPDDEMKNIDSSMYIYRNFDKEEYQKLLKSLTPQNCWIYLITQKLDDQPDQEFLLEKWYGTQFKKAKFTPELLYKMKHPRAKIDEDHKLGNPVPNTFFPSNIDVLPENPEESKTVKWIYSDDKMAVWYKKSDKFKTPKVNVTNIIYTNDCGFNASIEGKVFVTMWMSILNDCFREFEYMAEMASMDFERNSSDRKLDFVFNGYSDTIGEFIKQC